MRWIKDSVWFVKVDAKLLFFYLSISEWIMYFYFLFSEYYFSICLFQNEYYINYSNPCTDLDTHKRGCLSEQQKGTLCFSKQLSLPGLAPFPKYILVRYIFPNLSYQIYFPKIYPGKNHLMIFIIITTDRSWQLIPQIY